MIFPDTKLLNTKDGGFNLLLPPAYVVRREGTVFTGVCLSTGGGGVPGPDHPPRGGTRTPPGVPGLDPPGGYPDPPRGVPRPEPPLPRGYPDPLGECPPGGTRTPRRYPDRTPLGGTRTPLGVPPLGGYLDQTPRGGTQTPPVGGTRTGPPGGVPSPHTPPGGVAT